MPALPEQLERILVDEWVRSMYSRRLSENLKTKRLTSTVLGSLTRVYDDIIVIAAITMMSSCALGAREEGPSEQYLV